MALALIDVPLMMEEVNRMGDSDLLFTMTDCGVPLSAQWRLIRTGYTTLRKFSGIEDTRATVRASLVLDLGLDPLAVGDPGREARMTLATLVTAWESAKDRLGKETQIRTEAKALGVTRQVDVIDRTAMKRAVEAVFGKIPLHESPSSDYLSHKMEQLEDNDITASPLDEVSSLIDADLSATVPGWDNAGRSQLFRKRAKGSMPLTPEAFRTRLRIERNMWLFMATKFLNRPFLVGLTPAVFEEWTDYFLGGKVLLLEIVHADGTKHPLSPPWNIILSYELECRRHAVLKVQEEGITLMAGLAAAIRDPELKELAFTSAVAHLGRSSTVNRASASVAGQTNSQNPNWPNKKARTGPTTPNSGKSKGKGRKGKGKGKGAGKAKGTPDGRQICFSYNSVAGCSEPCPDSRLHVCRVRGCFGNHPMMTCPNAQYAPTLNSV